MSASLTDPLWRRAARTAMVVFSVGTGLSLTTGCPGRSPTPPATVDADAGTLDPCASFVGPARLGIVDAVVDAATVSRLLSWRRDVQHAQARNEFVARSPGSGTSTRLAVTDAHIEAGCVDLDGLVDIGRALFTRIVSADDGFGHGGVDDDRPGPAWRRVQRGVFGGPDARACIDCHWQGGDGGAGDRADNAYVLGDGIHVDSADARNPPSLFGAGWVERAAAEISADLARQRETLIAEVRTTRSAASRTLSSQGITFGVLQARPDGQGDVSVDTSAVVGVDADLIVKPFGSKGTVSDLRTFIGRSLQMHLGLQADEWVSARARGRGADVGGVDDGVGVDLVVDGGTDEDPDADGVTSELSSGQLTALVLFIATLDAPVFSAVEEAPLRAFELFSNELEFVRSPEFTARFARGAALFGRIGCASCHVPFVRVRDPRYQTASLSPAGRPIVVDLATDGAKPTPARDDEGAWLVPAFSDFKRHEMGPALASRYAEHGVPPSMWLTKRLWGLVQTAPYTHEGSALTIDEAVALHGGEAEPAARSFSLLDDSDRVDLRLFLTTLMRAPAPRVR
jgi:hypothetical protein